MIYRNSGIAAAMMILHALVILHCGLRSQNVVIDESCDRQAGDFGLMRQFDLR